jgi:aspartate/methionine/tyrosine aminotransferase
MPTLGSKEAVFSLAFIAMDSRGDKRVVVVTDPGYPIPERAALLAGAEVIRLPLREANGFLPDLSDVPEATWDRVAILWVNYPNNPTAAMASPAFFEPSATGTWSLRTRRTARFTSVSHPSLPCRRQIGPASPFSTHRASARR